MPRVPKEPLCVFATDNKVKTADAQKLRQMFSDEYEDLANMKIAVLSVAGRYRQGKSFLLNLMIRYLESNGAENWLTFDGDLRGFDWRHSRERVTRGVLLWPKIYKIRRPNGETIALVLMDTQGVCDRESSQYESTAIFSFSTLLSSIQVFNLSKDIQGDDFDRLQLFTQYGRLVAESIDHQGCPRGRTTPFQELVVLIRDWNYVDDEPYGWDGGQRVLDKELTRSDLTEELTSMRKAIKENFEKTRCYLMPHPGRAVESPSFTGRCKDIDEEFLKQIKIFIEDILGSDTLVAKCINGSELTVRDFCSYMDAYKKVYSNGELPPITTLFETTAKITNEILLSKCTNLYINEMRDAIKNGLQKYIFAIVHNNFRNEANKLMEKSAVMGPPATKKELVEKLQNQIESHYDLFKTANEALFEKRRTENMMADLEKKTKELEDKLKWAKESGDKSGSAIERTLKASYSELSKLTRTVSLLQEEAKQYLDATTEKQSSCTIL